MKTIAPPKLLQQFLMALLLDTARETVSGDLYEAYAERSRRSGPFSAAMWYFLQTLSFLPNAAMHAYARNPILALVCCFTAASGAWLGTMSIVLRHQHLVRSESIAGAIVVQGLLTLAVLPVRRIRLLRWFALAGCLPLLWLACSALYSTLHSSDTEGYILLICFALIVQCVLTMIAMFREPKPAATA